MTRQKKQMDAQTLEILSSIKQIIADDGADKGKTAPTIKAVKAAPKKSSKKKTPVRKSAVKAPQDDVLVLTEVAPEEPAISQKTTEPRPPQPPQQTSAAETSWRAEGLVEKLEMDDALEELVRSLLREKLDEYLDQHLSDIVKKVAAEELAKKRSGN